MELPSTLSALRRFAGLLAVLIIGNPEYLRAQEQCSPYAYEPQSNHFSVLEEQYKHSVILVNCGGELPGIANIGTGFLIDSRKGLFLTAYHVVKHKDGKYDCTKRDSRLVAYPAGNMCQQTDLEYITGAPELDIALLQIKDKRTEHFFYSKPQFDLLTQGMKVNENELELIGFSQFAAILQSEPNTPARKTLPGTAGGHKCTGQPQRYKFNPFDVAPAV